MSRNILQTNNVNCRASSTGMISVTGTLRKVRALERAFSNDLLTEGAGGVPRKPKKDPARPLIPLLLLLLLMVPLKAEEGSTATLALSLPNPPAFSVP